MRRNERDGLGIQWEATYDLLLQLKYSLAMI
jgi:hypothetical protein